MMWPQTVAQTIFAFGVFVVDVAGPSGGSPGRLAPPMGWIASSFLLGFPALIGNWYGYRFLSNIQGTDKLMSCQNIYFVTSDYYYNTPRGCIIFIVAALTIALESVANLHRCWRGCRGKLIPGISALYNLYRNWWDPSLLAQRNAKRSRRDFWVPLCLWILHTM